MAQRSKGGRGAFVCTACGTGLPKWAGQCPDCGAWNSVEEVLDLPAPRGRSTAGYAGAGGSAGVVALSEIAPEERARAATGIGELDRVLGGGLVQGSVVLIGGDPGIGR